jgi:hypothetical protein
MFNKKIKIIEREIDGKTRYILDFIKTKINMENVLIDITKEYKNAFVLFDSDISETPLSETVKQANKITDYLKENGISYDIIKYKVDSKKGLMQRVFTSRKRANNYQYKIAFIINNDKFNDIIKLHLKYSSNLRFGLNFINKNIKESERNFISNMINDENRFEYYNIDLFYNYELKRIALFSENEDEIKNIISLYKE